ncbi:AP2 domain-containing protein [Candidatus Gracilibacteria bacterium]|nr:AP2 domain-containing protein [Candidatus Gracilibacteria bacterium]
MSAPDVQPVSLPDDQQPPRSRQKTTRYKGISRIDHKRTHGYFARVSWEGRVHSKLFSDKKHGDRLAALAAALEWRDEMEKQLGKPRTEEMVFGKAVAGSSKIGIHKRVKDGRLVYEATWREGQKVKRTSYSIRKHGEKKARALAIAARERAQARKLAARYGDAVGSVRSQKLRGGCP